MSIRKRLQSIIWRVPVEQEVRDEIAHHVELRTRDLMAAGLSPAAARAEAERRLGDVGRLSAELNRLGEDRNRWFRWREWLDELGQDLSFSWRQCRTRPGFALAAVVTLAIGLGATTAIFSIVHAVVLKPFPSADPERVLLVFTRFRDLPGNVSVGNFEYIRRRVTTVEHLSSLQNVSFNLSDGGDPERVPGARVTAPYFSVFGVPPLAGRTFLPEEDQPGRGQVAVLSEKLWRRRFAADPSIVGRSIRMNGEPYTVIGIMPAPFDEIGQGEEAWVPAAFTAERLAMYDEHYLTLVGLRQAEVTLAQVNDELQRIARQLAADVPDHNKGRGAGAQVLGHTVVGDYRTRLFVLLAAVAMVLAIACGNVANLLMARLAARSRELAIRTAIGASRGRIIRQVLTESLVLCAVGGAVGVLAASWFTPILVSLAPAGVPRLESATLNGTVLAAAAALVCLSTAVVGLLPAWQATRKGDLRPELGDGKGAVSASLRPLMRQALIGAQAALVVVVLSGAALLVRSAINLQQVPIGFDTSNVLAARVALPERQYATAEQAQQAFAQMLERIQSSAGVEAAALDSQPPLLANGGSNGLLPEGHAADAVRINSQSHFVTPDYFRLLRLPLKAGRTFADTDIRQAPLVMVVNETLARAAFGDRDPIGQRMICCEGSPDDPRYKVVVGVVADIHARGPSRPAVPEFYLPIRQIPDPAWTWTGRSLQVLVRGGDRGALAAAIRGGVRQIDPSLPVFAMRTLDEGLRQSLAQSRFNTILMSLLGAIGLALASLGIYSVVAWLVSQRAREIGVRMALGATVGQVVTAVTLHGLAPVVIGLLAGVGGALATTRLLAGQLFQVEPRDPLVLGVSVVLFLLVATAAALLPAWRAARIDPSRALQE